MITHNLIDKVALIKISDKKVLSTRSKSKEKFYFPGGKRENNESDVECLTREIFEELNVHIVADSMKPFGTFEAQADGHDINVNVRMICYFADFTGILKVDNEIESFEWIEYKDRDRTSAVDNLILKRLKELDLIN